MSLRRSGKRVGVMISEWTLATGSNKTQSFYKMLQKQDTRVRGHPPDWLSQVR